MESNKCSPQEHLSKTKILNISIIYNPKNLPKVTSFYNFRRDVQIKRHLIVAFIQMKSAIDITLVAFSCILPT